ncbi:hypothetical protein EXIGLDRAFT_464913 [Exidia glandulosa HHB12029]|uniref:F-box domain-containing protein n=1 Tax=Exidia glandulosa HHB12029 TaxID=1314781 RepID=A0A165K1R8_EXIGL|nr:hypothetical protein EXIGLDRAFT_464913 [Exidia glandulosa HHB12029]
MRARVRGAVYLFRLLQDPVAVRWRQVQRGPVPVICTTKPASCRLSMLTDDVVNRVLDLFAFEDLPPVLAICRRWRHLALRHPSYWADITVRKTSPGAVELFQLQLARSGTRRIRLTIKILEPWDLFPAAVLPALVAHISHVGTLTLKLTAIHMSSSLDTLRLPAPLLTRMSLFAVMDPGSFSLDESSLSALARRHILRHRAFAAIRTHDKYHITTSGTSGTLYRGGFQDWLSIRLRDANSKRVPLLTLIEHRLATRKDGFLFIYMTPDLILRPSQKPALRRCCRVHCSWQPLLCGLECRCVRNASEV